jgi:hypothetical protein
MIKLTITQIGTPKVMQKRDGSGTFEKNWLKAKEYNDEFLNFIVGKTTSQWKAGMTVEVEAVEPREYTAKDGSLKTSYDIKLPKFKQNNEEVLNAITKMELRLMDALRQIYEAVSTNKPDFIPGTNKDYPTPESVGIDVEKAGNFEVDDELGFNSLKEEQM